MTQAFNFYSGLVYQKHEIKIVYVFSTLDFSVYTKKVVFMLVADLSIAAKLQQCEFATPQMFDTLFHWQKLCNFKWLSFDVALATQSITVQVSWIYFSFVLSSSFPFSFGKPKPRKKLFFGAKILLWIGKNFNSNNQTNSTMNCLSAREQVQSLQMKLFPVCTLQDRGIYEYMNFHINIRYI